MIRVAILALGLTTLTAGDPIWKPKNSSKRINPFTPGGRIVGGQPTTIEEHPWQVSLQNYGFHFCGGSIISKNVVLTAAHCATVYPAETINIRVGSVDKNDGGVLHEVEKIESHEKFKTGIFGIPVYDVAILKLKSPIELNDKAQPIPLFDANEKVVEGTLSTISGWGALSEGGSPPEVLYTVDVPIVNKEACNEAYFWFGGVPDGQICAAFPEGGKDTCQGDSGGPLVIDGRQAGIVSWGNGCAKKGYPGVYTEIAAVREWLTQHASV